LWIKSPGKRKFKKCWSHPPIIRSKKKTRKNWLRSKLLHPVLISRLRYRRHFREHSTISSPVKNGHYPQARSLRHEIHESHEIHQCLGCSMIGNHYWKKKRNFGGEFVHKCRMQRTWLRMRCISGKLIEDYCIVSCGR